MERQTWIVKRSHVSLSSDAENVQTCAIDLCDGVAFVNIGLVTYPCEAVTNHSTALTKMTRELFKEFRFLIGICFCECGEVQKGFDQQTKELFEDVIAQGFAEAGVGFPVFVYTCLLYTSDAADE